MWGKSCFNFDVRNLLFGSCLSSFPIIFWLSSIMYSTLLLFFFARFWAIHYHSRWIAQNLVLIFWGSADNSAFSTQTVEDYKLCVVVSIIKITFSRMPTSFLMPNGNFIVCSYCCRCLSVLFDMLYSVSCKFSMQLLLL